MRKVFHISGGTPHHSAAESVFRSYNASGGEISLRGIGMSAIQQMVKTVAVCTRLFKERMGIDVITSIKFVKVNLAAEGQPEDIKTALECALLFQRKGETK